MAFTSSLACSVRSALIYNMIVFGFKFYITHGLKTIITKAGLSLIQHTMRDVFQKLRDWVYKCFILFDK